MPTAGAQRLGGGQTPVTFKEADVAANTKEQPSLSYP